MAFLSTLKSDRFDVGYRLDRTGLHAPIHLPTLFEEEDEDPELANDIIVKAV
jgi:hypothetical protein